jgi:putative ABC transport system permease protein
VRVKAKKLRSPIFIRKIFGYEGELAYKNMKRNGRKSRIITSSLALSIVLFLSVYSFCDMFSEVTRLSAQNPYQVYAYVDLQDTDRFREEVSALGNFDKMYSVNATYGMGLTTAKDNFVNGYDRMFSSEEGGFPLYLCYVDDNDFNAMCEENGINPKPFYKGNSMVVMNCMEHTSSAAKIFSDSVIGTTFSSTKDANDPLTGYTIGALVPYRDTSYVYNLAAPVYVMAFAPVSAAQFAGSYTFGFETTEHEAFSEDVQDILENGNYADSGVMDMVSSIEMMNSTTLIMQVFLYGFITLMALISVANIFNTVSTNIDLRRKEFAMLKSVGVTPKGFIRMLRFESLFYGLKALVFGLPLGLLCSYFMQQILASGSFDIAFYPDWRVYLGVTLAVFLIVGMSMWYATSKVKKDTIVETLKTEIN